MGMPKKLQIALIVSAGLLPLGPIQAAAPEAPPFKTLVLAGDSITENPTGYAALIELWLLERYGAKAPRVINAGKSSDRVAGVLKRLEADVLAHRPDVVAVCIGVNDVAWWQKEGTPTPPERYRADLEAIVKRLRESGARVLLGTPALLWEKTDGTSPSDTRLEQYCALSREAAQAAGAETVDLRARMVAALKQRNPDQKDKGVLTYDGLHLNFAGNCVVAAELLRKLGFSDADDPDFASAFKRFEARMNEHGAQAVPRARQEAAKP